MKILYTGLRILCLSSLLCTSFALADDVGRGGDAGAFVRIGLGARAMGMGGGSVAIIDGANTAYYNPGGLGFIENRLATGSLHAMPLNRTLTYRGYAQPLRKSESGRD